MKVIFAGTPNFAAKALESLIPHHDIVAVLTQPDRPAGRGMQMLASPVKQLAQQKQLKVLQPPSLKTAEIQAELASMKADVMVVAAYGLILPKTVLEIPALGCLNIHASLLPRWRGAAPIQRAIQAGDTETGITIMQMDEGLDTGIMLLKKRCPITVEDNANTLHDKLALLGADAIVEALEKLPKGQLESQIQDNSFACYAAKLSKSEAKIDWSQSAKQISCTIRAFNPFPGAFSTLNETPVKIWQVSETDNASAEPGTVQSVGKQGIRVACGTGALMLEILQRPNGKLLPASQFVQGFPIKPGDRFSAD